MSLPQKQGGTFARIRCVTIGVISSQYQLHGRGDLVRRDFAQKRSLYGIKDVGSACQVGIGGRADCRGGGKNLRESAVCRQPKRD